MKVSVHEKQMVPVTSFVSVGFVRRGRVATAMHEPVLPTREFDFPSCGITTNQGGMNRARQDKSPRELESGYPGRCLAAVCKGADTPPARRCGRGRERTLH